jgi:hypothetical protein
MKDKTLRASPLEIPKGFKRLRRGMLKRPKDRRWFDEDGWNELLFATEGCKVEADEVMIRRIKAAKPSKSKKSRGRVTGGTDK